MVHLAPCVPWGVTRSTGSCSAAESARSHEVNARRVEHFAEAAARRLDSRLHRLALALLELHARDAEHDARQRRK